MKPMVSYGMILVLALLLGFVWHAKKSGPDTSGLIEAFAAMKSSGRVLTSAREQEIAGMSRLQLNEGGEENWLRWLAELENAEANDLPRFLRNTPNTGSAYDLVAERWLELGPENALEYFRKRFETGEMGANVRDKEASFLATLINKWADRDLESALASMEGMESFPFQQDRFRDLAGKLVGKDPERGVRLALKHNVHKTGRTFIVRGGRLKKWIERDPHTAAELIFEWERASYALNDLAKVWGRTNAKEAIAFGLERGGKDGRKLADEAFGHWARRDYGEAADWLGKVATDEEAEIFTQSLIGVWCETEPQAALDWCGLNLEGRFLAETVSRLVVAAVDSKSMNPGDLLKSIQSPDAHRAAAVALSHRLWDSRSEFDNTGLALKQLRWFDEVSDAETLNQIASGLSSAGYFQEGAEWLEAFARSPKMKLLRSYQASSLMEGIAGDNSYEKALDLVVQVAEVHQPNVASALFASWAGSQPEKAVAWTKDLDDDDPRRPHLGADLAQRFMNEARRKVDDESELRELVEALNPGLRGLVREGLIRKKEGLSNYSIQTGSQKIDFDLMIEALAE